MKVVADAHIPNVKKYFSGAMELNLIPGRAISRKDVQDADILLVRSVTPVNESLLMGSRVKFVGSVTAGADHLDTVWLAANGIRWQVAEGFNALAVADYVVSVVAALQHQQLLLSKSLRAAVVGVGAIGRFVAERLSALNFEVVYCDPLRADRETSFYSTPLTELMDLDLISLHVPLTRAGPYPTYHLINQAFLQRQKPGCVLLNTSRGAVVDTQQLKIVGKHLCWCLDVWEHEPKIDQAVLTHTTIATPHIAGYSVQSKIRGIERIYRTARTYHLVPLLDSAIEMPMQRLPVIGGEQNWQSIVLQIFNPLIMTAMLKSRSLSTKEPGLLFDTLRHQFHGRYEFASILVKESQVLPADRRTLKQLGFNVLPKE
jgi:erythronate-4-phosphate dehydrogenase